jgi:hypothetical protein
MSNKIPQNEIKTYQQRNTAQRRAVPLSSSRKHQIDSAVKRVVEQYGETLKLLAKE